MVRVGKIAMGSFLAEKRWLKKGVTGMRVLVWLWIV